MANRPCLVGLAVLAVVLGGAGQAQAQVTVSIEPGAGAEYAASLGIDLGELEAQLQDGIETAFAALNPNGYLKAFSNAQAFSNRGLGVDYASNPNVLSCGAAANLSAGLDDELDDDYAVSPGLNMSLMCGLNLGTLEPKLRNLTIYVNAFRFKSSAFVETLEGTLTSFGAHAQYKLFRPANTKKQLILQWGGLDITSGVEYSRLSVNLNSDSLFRELPVIGDDVADAASGAVGFDSTGLFELSTNTFVVPIEVSTNLRIAYLLTVFGGLGFDFQVGNSDLNVALSGDLTAEDPNDPSQEIDLGTANVQVEGASSPSPGRLRTFAGLQLNLWRVKLFLQANVRPDPAAVGLTLGGRLAW